MAAGFLSRGEVLWLVNEILKHDRHIKSETGANRFTEGRRSGLATAAVRLLRVEAARFEDYMDWVYEQVVSNGKRVGELEEPGSWTRKTK
jgi:hypothetical protein